MTTPAERILVVGPAWVGDMVMAQSLFMRLREQAADCVIDVLAPAWSQPLLARMDEVREAIILPVGHGRLALAQRYRLGRSLRGRYDRAIVIPRSFKSALVPWFARIPRRSGYRGEMRYGLLNDIRTLDKQVLHQTVQRYVALGERGEMKDAPPTPLPHLRVEPGNRERVVQQLGLDTQRPVVAMMPGAEYGPAKRWPPVYYAQVARAQVAAGRQVWLFGSHKDQAVAETIVREAAGTAAAQNESVVNLCGRTRLEDAVDLLSLVRVALSNDSGLMHVAAAVGVPLVAVYGSSTPDYTPPLSPRAEVVYHALACSPCFKRSCPLGHTDCLNGITPDEVLQRIEKQAAEVS